MPWTSWITTRRMGTQQTFSCFTWWLMSRLVTPTICGCVTFHTCHIAISVCGHRSLYTCTQSIHHCSAHGLKSLQSILGTALCDSCIWPLRTGSRRAARWGPANM